MIPIFTYRIFVLKNKICFYNKSIPWMDRILSLIKTKGRLLIWRECVHFYTHPHTYYMCTTPLRVPIEPDHLTRKIGYTGSEGKVSLAELLFWHRSLTASSCGSQTSYVTHTYICTYIYTWDLTYVREIYMVHSHALRAPIFSLLVLNAHFTKTWVLLLLLLLLVGC